MGKGVSAAEKRQKMIDMFQAESTVFTKKEVEKLAPRTGIVSGAVEAVLRELINDDIVHEGKLSGTLFYWSFPGEVAMKKRAELASFQAKAGQLEQQARSRFAKSLLAQIEQMRKAAGQSASEAAELNEQEGLLTSIMAAETEARENIEKEKKKSGQNMHARKRDLKVLKEAANRWTDNLFMIKSKLVESGADVKNVDGMLGTDRIDYIE
eukprot:jgi/Chrpa1/2483/Chrysochromulina_OHIO_Genome00001331-RA